MSKEDPRAYEPGIRTLMKWGLPQTMDTSEWYVWAVNPTNGLENHIVVEAFPKIVGSRCKN